MCCYDPVMQEKSLFETNPYLRDPEQFRTALIASVASSTAIETGASIESIVRTLTDAETTKSLMARMPRDSAR